MNQAHERPALVCPACGNDRHFDAIKTYYHKVILDGSAEVIESRRHSDEPGEELEISCRRCAHPVEAV